MALAAFHPDRFGYAGSMSGFLYPSSTNYNGAILAGLQQFGGVDGNRMWGAPQLGRWKWHDPYVHAALLAQNDTRIWVYSAKSGASDPAAVLGYPDQATKDQTWDSTSSTAPSAGTMATSTSPGQWADNGWGSWSGRIGRHVWLRCHPLACRADARQPVESADAQAPFVDHVQAGAAAAVTIRASTLVRTRRRECETEPWC